MHDMHVLAWCHSSGISFAMQHAGMICCPSLQAPQYHAKQSAPHELSSSPQR
ncbi:hypothetical protein MTR_8g099530 [Medicago truncatula]|uniref:Uncharacterized protein n=1 Tax=Medicago truncatula TaxID=3880 RepID=A0A072TUN1_MEDTR|nr:hypothetical protein MTR_8g099530 [Medicago truncatula]